MQNGSLPSLAGKRPLQWIAEQTEGYSGADLHQLAAEAARISLGAIVITPSFRCVPQRHCAQLD